MAMLGDPLVLFADAPTETLRREVLSGVRRLLGEPEPSVQAEQPAHRGRRGRGRPVAMPPDAVATARQMHASGSHTVAEIATILGVSRATVYRHLGQTPHHVIETINET